MSFYFVYRTTNLINTKFYIGVHKTDNLSDTYIGSGKLLRKAICKYGAENFHREILHIFDNPADAFKKEEELVEVNKSNPLCYNLRKGGSGGFDYINKNGLSRTPEAIRKISEKLKGKPSHENSKRGVTIANSKRKWSEKSKKKLSSSLKGRIVSEETRKKLRESKLGKPAWNRGRKMPEGFGGKISMAKRGLPRPASVRIAVANANRLRPKVKWINKYGQQMKVKLTEIDKYLEDGWQFGRLSPH